MSDLSRELREAAKDDQLSGASWHYGFTQADLRWIALCSPDKIKALCDQADAAEGLAEAAEAYLAPLPIRNVIEVAKQRGDKLREALASFRAQEAEILPSSVAMGYALYPARTGLCEDEGLAEEIDMAYRSLRSGYPAEAEEYLRNILTKLHAQEDKDA